MVLLRAVKHFDDARDDTRKVRAQRSRSAPLKTITTFPCSTRISERFHVE